MPAATYPVFRMYVAKRLNAIHLLLLFSGVLLTLCAWLAGGPTEILGVLPAVLLVGCLALGRYPGEELIARLAERFRPPRLRPTSVTSPRRRFTSFRPRLLALAGVRPLRGPPLHS